MREAGASIAVVIPCYRVGERVLDVIARIPAEVDRIFCVDDACPLGTGELVRTRQQDPRVVVLRHDVNQGVGGATMTGYRAALEAGADIIVKVDGDGQMDPALIPQFVGPLREGAADYTKGNRFHFPSALQGMPLQRLLGNAVLSFANKLSTGYWNVFDPTNGYTAIHASVLRELPFDRISRRYFFESDLLFRLSLVRAVVRDVPMKATYQGEPSSLSIPRVIPEFLWGHVKNTWKRIFYGYFIRDFNIASLAGVLGTAMFTFGVVFGGLRWARSVKEGVTASAGTVMLSGLPIIVGIELLLSALNFDITNTPRVPIHPVLGRRDA